MIGIAFTFVAFIVIIIIIIVIIVIIINLFIYLSPYCFLTAVTTIMATGRIVNWVVPATGLYLIAAYGAQGAGAGSADGCLGASMQGLFSLSFNQTLSILVGVKPNILTFPGGGGGWFCIYIYILCLLDISLFACLYDSIIQNLC